MPSRDPIVNYCSGNSVKVESVQKRIQCSKGIETLRLFFAAQNKM